MGHPIYIYSKIHLKNCILFFKLEITMFLLLMNEFHLELELSGRTFRKINILSRSTFRRNLMDI